MRTVGRHVVRCLLLFACRRLLLPARLVVLAVLLVSLPAHAITLAEIEQKAEALRAAEGKLNAEREAAFQREFSKQQKLLKDAQSARDAAEASSNSLSQRFDANEQRMDELEQLLKEHQGNLGELFGVTRQVAGDAASELRQSVISAQFLDPQQAEDRETFLRRLATAKALPSIVELERMWFELQREMTAQAEVVRFTAPVQDSGGETTNAEVVRVGPFTASAGDRYLAYLPGEKTLVPYRRQPPARLRDLAAALASANSGYAPAVVDPSRGALFSMYVDRPGWRERIKLGGMIGYITIAIGLLGIAVWAGQLLYLMVVRAAVWWQLRHLEEPSARNPLGRLLLALRAEPVLAGHSDMAELQISAAVLREVPRLERFQGFLRLAVAAGPLLGLIGTVIGMIITFQTITASGASDPKLVAHGIGQAMIATVLGLGIAIPLLFANSLLAALSRSVIQTLDEYGEGLLADSLSQKRAA